jgi:hypothetical protein
MLTTSLLNLALTMSLGAFVVDEPVPERPASAASDARGARQALTVELRLMQIHARRDEVSIMWNGGLLVSPTTIPRGDSGTASSGASRSSDASGPAGTGHVLRTDRPVLIGRSPRITIRGRTLILDREQIVERVEGVEQVVTESADWSMLCAPRLMLRSGDAGEMSVGRSVPYMTLNADGSLSVHENEQAFEGIRISLRAEAASSDRIRLSDVRVRLSRLASRLPIEGVPFDVGAPVMQSREMSVSVTVAPTEVAMISMAAIVDDADEAESPADADSDPAAQSADDWNNILLLIRVWPEEQGSVAKE